MSDKEASEGDAGSTVDAYGQRERESQPEKGEYPFRIMESSTESIFLTWLRNHSSYLAASGFVGTLAAIGVYLRGLFANLLMLSVIFIPLGGVLGLYHYDLLSHTFYLSGTALAVGIISMLAFFAARLGDPRDQVPIGSWMSVMPGLIVGVILLLITIEFSPHIIELTRKQLPETSFGVVECVTLIFSLGATGGAVVQYLPKNASLRQTLGLSFIALIGLALLWFVVLRIANYVYYGIPPSKWWQHWSPVICLVLLTGCFVTSMWWRAERTVGQRLGKTAVAIVIAAVVFVPCVFATRYMQMTTDAAAEGLGSISRPLSRMIRGLQKSEAINDGKIKRLVDENRKLEFQGKAQQNLATPSRRDESGSVEAIKGRSGLGMAVDKLGTIWGVFASASLESLRHETELTPEYYRNAQLFLEHVEQVKTDDLGERQVLLDQLTDSALTELIDVRLRQEEAPIKGQLFVQKWIAATIREKLDGVDSSAILSKSEAELSSWMTSTLSLSRLESDYNRLLLKPEQAKRVILLTKWLPSDDAGNSGEDVQEELLPRKLSAVVPFAAEDLGAFWRNIFLRQLAVTSERDPDELLRVRAVSSLPEHDRDFIFWFKIFGGPRFSELVEIAVPLSDDIDRKGLLEKVQKTVDRQHTQSGSLPEGSLIAVPEQKQARSLLLTISLTDGHPMQESARLVLSELYDPEVPPPQELVGETKRERSDFAMRIYSRPMGKDFASEELDQILVAAVVPNSSMGIDMLLRRMVHGRYGNFEDIEHAGDELFQYSFTPKAILLGVLWISALVFCNFFGNPNLSSAHGFYRDRLANAFVLSKSSAGEVVPDIGVKLSQLCNTGEGKSTSPYHLINAALNINSSELERVRDRNADFFFFSKLYCGGNCVGYIPTKSLEAASPELTVASAMAISAGAASPNMGKYTPGVLTFLLALLNVRLGQWIPNPKQLRKDPIARSQSENLDAVEQFEQVYRAEMGLIEERRANCGDSRRSDILPQVGCESTKDETITTVQRQLVGLALSGGGIRSASVSLGCTQALDRAGLLNLVDYLSTVSGGGYTGTAISTFMREREDISGTESPAPGLDCGMLRKLQQNWRARFRLFFCEMIRKVGATQKWIYLSDGGHFENLGVYELLRRRCAIIIACDGEEDKTGAYPGLSAVKRLAEIDMNIKVDFPTGALAKICAREEVINGVVKKIPPVQHFAIGKVTYPPRPELGERQHETGYVLYLRSSLIGDEDQVIAGYKSAHDDFPHETTADQSFDEVQFEAYRRLGEKITNAALADLAKVRKQQSSGSWSYEELCSSVVEIAMVPE